MKPASCLLVLVGCVLGVVAPSTRVHAADEIDFAHDVLPILKARCAKCHTNGTYKGGLNLESRADLLKSKAISKGNADESELFQRVISRDENVRMPPEGDALTAKEQAILRRWIQADTPWPNEVTLKNPRFQRPLKLRPQPKWLNAEPAAHPLDTIVERHWQEHNVTPPKQIDDATFLRRVYFDLIGLPPTPEELSRFLMSKQPTKRADVVRELLDRDQDYAEHWLTFWNDLLRNDYAGTGYIDGGRKQITTWLYASLKSNKPYDQFVEELVAPTPESEGFIKGIKWRGRVNASQVRELQFSQNIGQVFLGINLKCASCHDSFIDDWKLTDAYGLAAVTSDRPLEIHRCDQPTGEMASAGFVFPQLGTIDATKPRQERLNQLAKLLTHPDNGRLPRTIVNRLWERLIGRGLVHPVDVMANEAWSEPLLDELSRQLVQSEFNVKETLALIATSRAYQSSTNWQATGDAVQPQQVFRGPLPKRLTAEQFVDAIWQITGTAPNKPAGKVAWPNRNDATVRAALVISDPLMRVLGRPNREQVVTTRPADLTTLQALELSNGAEFTKLLGSAAKGWQSQHATEKPAQQVHSIFLAALSREPNAREVRLGQEILGDNPTEADLSDLFWTVFMLPEFHTIR